MDWMQSCQVFCKQAKFVGEEINWDARSNHVGATSARSSILNHNRVVIAGLEFRGEVQYRNYGPYQKYSLMYDMGGRKLRVFALEVLPAHKRSHVEGGVELYGPHIHLGDDREPGSAHRARSVLSRLDPKSVQGWITRFQRHAKVSDGHDFKLTPPFPDDLFGHQ